MDLEEFVQTTLTQIIAGIQKAQQAVGPDAQQGVCPAINLSKVKFGDSLVSREGQLVHMIDFDVAVTAESSSEAGGKLGIKVATIVEIGGGGSSTNQDTVVSRVKFQVPITYPEP